MFGDEDDSEIYRFGIVMYGFVYYDYIVEVVRKLFL